MSKNPELRSQLEEINKEKDALLLEYEKTMRRIYLWVIDLAFKRIKSFKSISAPETKLLEKITPQKAQMLELRCGKSGLVDLANERCNAMFRLKKLKNKRDHLIAQI